MKQILKICVVSFFLVVPSQANDISEFQIGGISLGESLLNYVKEEKIRRIMKTDYPNSKKFSRIFIKLPDVKEYSNIMFHFKTNDKKYIIHSISGQIGYRESFEQCLSNKEKVSLDVSEVFLNSNLNKVKSRKKHSLDNESIVDNEYFFFPNGGFIEIGCYDWSKKTEKKLNYVDHLKVAIISKEFDKFLAYEAFK